MLGKRAQAVESADEHVRLMQLIVLVLSKRGQVTKFSSQNKTKQQEEEQNEHCRKMTGCT